jgi:isocitrate lyase
MGGKVLVPISEHVNRLIAIRVQYDIMGVNNLIISRTDSEAATLLTSNVDARDHAFILGSTNPNLRPLVEVMREEEAKGILGSQLSAIEEKWLSDAKLKLYNDAVVDAIKASNFSDKNSRLQKWLSQYQGLSHYNASKLAKSLGIDVFWDWDAPRTREGLYRYQGGTKCAINRSIAFAPYCDLLWMETAKPIYAQAQEFATGVHRVHPEAMLAYNLSPSFNCKYCLFYLILAVKYLIIDFFFYILYLILGDAAGMTDEEIRNFISNLGKLGFVWQFITLGGFHSNALGVDTFAKDYKKRGMLAYVEGIQRKEREYGVETLQHQKWSGANYVDQLILTVTGGVNSTTAMGKGVTEDQFKN